MRQDQGDRLGVFVVDEFCDLLRIGFLQGVKAGHLRSQSLHEAVHHPLGRFRAERV